MQSPRLKKNTFRERYYFFVLSRAWNKEKILNPHRQGRATCGYLTVVYTQGVANLSLAWLGWGI